VQPIHLIGQCRLALAAEREGDLLGELRKNLRNSDSHGIEDAIFDRGRSWK
jgi:hypothetical protein